MQKTRAYADAVK